MNNGTEISLGFSYTDYEGKVKKFIFDFIVYRVTVDNLFLGRDFYNQYGKLPGAMHHEVEIVGIDFSKFEEPALFHFHKSIDERREFFVCYPLPMPTIQSVLDTLNIWCLGTMFSMIWKFDFQWIFNEENKENFLEILEIEYGLAPCRVSA